MVAHPLSLHFQCIAAAGHPLGPPVLPGSVLFVPHTRGSRVSVVALPPIITSRFAHALRSLINVTCPYSQGGVTPCKFPSGRQGQLKIGWFWAVRIRTRGVRQIKHLGARLQQGFW